VATGLNIVKYDLVLLFTRDTLAPLDAIAHLHCYVEYSVLNIAEFASQPQHETSSDSGIHLISDINDLKNKSRKRPRSLSLISINSSDWNEYWETKTSQLMNNGLSNKRITIEQIED